MVGRLLLTKDEFVMTTCPPLLNKVTPEPTLEVKLQLVMLTFRHLSKNRALDTFG